MPAALVLIGGISVWIATFVVLVEVLRLDASPPFERLDGRLAEARDGLRAVLHGDPTHARWATGLKLLQGSVAVLGLLVGLTFLDIVPGWSGAVIMPALTALAGWQLVASYGKGVEQRHRRELERNLLEIISLTRLLFVRGPSEALRAASELAPGPVADALKEVRAAAGAGVSWTLALELRLRSLPGPWIEQFLDALHSASRSRELSLQLLSDLERRIREERRESALERIKKAEVHGSAAVAACTALVVLLVFVAPAVMQVLRALPR